MPIFSNRSIASMLAAIASAAGPVRERDLRQRLAGSVEGAIAAEWEVAVTYSCAQQGGIAFPEMEEGVKNPDLIFRSPRGSQALIEVTALSDASHHERNAMPDFDAELRRVLQKNGIYKLGAIHTSIGSMEGSRGPVLGVPLRRDMPALFSSPEFRTFIRAIKERPTESRTFQFAARGIRSSVRFQPGSTTSGGTHRVYTGIADLERNPFTSRLKTKDRQIAASGIDLPAVVVLCDAHCNAISSTMTGIHEHSLDRVVDHYLNGRPTVQLGPWLVQRGAPARSRRINAVVVLSLHEQRNVGFGERVRRSIRSQVIVNRGETHHVLDPEIISHIVAGTRLLPNAVNMPINARTRFKYPAFYGGHVLSFGGETMKVKMSLLTLQGLLSGTLSYEEFARDHKETIDQLKRQSDNGKMISSVRIEAASDDDDDWIEFELSGEAPDSLFKQGGAPQ